MRFAKPPLIEIYAEVHLSDPKPTQSELLPLVGALTSGGLGALELTNAFELASMSWGPSTPTELPATLVPRFRCWSVDKKKLVQVSPGTLVINQVGDYLGWTQFSDLFSAAIGHFGTHLPSAGISSLALATIDRIVVPQAGFRVGRYLNCAGEMIPAWFSDVACACDLTLGRGFLPADGLNRQLRLSVRQEAETFALRLDSVFHDRLQDRNALESRLEALNSESTRTFLSLLTKEARDVFGEIHGTQ